MRLPDWRSRLADYVAATARAPYRPGRHDCILFAAGGRAALTGVDVMADWRGRYTTVQEGLELALQHGCTDPWAHVVSGLEEVPVAYGAVGDIALLDGADGLPAMGIIQGEMIYTVHPRGAALVPLTEARRVWRV
ncbi:DUF6950 family protein [Tabrizicola fusiformis]|uniref:DUF6950 family protein n=1 Tax=Tabrizicola sp. SY72 TaxID=2741673 RepID=UPI0015736F67|nr:hypothetical protein [Tabrizicola sp. SY72]NTT88274.1 hypothetical protein [Tabrizicola sp. SY72]